MANEYFTDEDMNEMAAEARLDRPADPMEDDLESVSRKYHEAMAKFQVAHHSAKEEAVANRQCYSLVMIGGKACDPELELRIAELEGMKEQAMEHIRTISKARTAKVMLHHMGQRFFVSPLSHD